MNSTVYNGTFFFFQASLLIRILHQFETKISYDHVTKIPRDDGLLSEATMYWVLVHEVTGSNPTQTLCFYQTFVDLFLCHGLCS